MKHKIVSGAAAAIATAALVVASAGGASAAWDTCPTGKSCFWGDPEYVTLNMGSAHLWFEYYLHDFSDFNYPGTTINGTNSASSVTNNGTMARTQYFAGMGYTYPVFTLRPGGERDPNLSNGIDTIDSPYWPGDQVDDALSSACFIGSC